MEKRFLILGGDRRREYLARELRRYGCRALLAAPQEETAGGALSAEFEEALAVCENVILPTPLFRADGFLNAAGDLAADAALAQKLRGKRIFVSGSAKLIEKDEAWRELNLCDYSSLPLFRRENAIPSAEGALAEAIRLYPGTIRGAKTLVAGYGAIGKALCGILRALGAEVTASARRKEDLLRGEAEGISMIETASLDRGGPFQLIFNTIPAPVFGKKALAALPKEAVLLDLASAPGGVDFTAAKRLGIDARLLPGLPGKYSPAAAGAIAAKAVLFSLEGEEND